MIRSIWRITRNASDAEDAMQEALMVIWRRLHRLRMHASPQALVLKICIDSACGRGSPPLSTSEVGGNASLSRAGSRRRSLSLWTNWLTRNCPVRFSAPSIGSPDHRPWPSRCASSRRCRTSRVAAAMDCSAATARKHVERARKRLQVVLARASTRTSRRELNMSKPDDSRPR